MRRLCSLAGVVGLLAGVGLVGALVATTGCGDATHATLPPADGDGDDEVPSRTDRAADIAAWNVDGDFLVSPTLFVPDGATRVAAIVRTTRGDVDVALQARGDDGAFVPMEQTWRDSARGTRLVVRADLGARVHAVQLRLPRAARDVVTSITSEAVEPVVRDLPSSPTPASSLLPALPTPDVAPGFDVAPQRTQAVLDGFEPRSAWGARAPSGCSSNPTKTRVTVHHTVQALGAGGTRDEFAAEIRADQALHMDGRGYCDIAYHFLVTSDGTVWEGRAASSLGAHTGGQNTDNLGVSFIGCFHPTSDCDGMGSTTPPAAMIDGAGAFIGRAAAHFGITLDVGTTLLGHRDNPDQATACPGDNLHDRLPDLLARATGVPPPSTTTTGRVQGIVWDLSITSDITQSSALGARLVGATVTADGSSSSAVSTTTRAGDAYWSLDLPPGSHTITASADGFAPVTRTITLVAGDSAWSSIGLSPAAVATDVSVRVLDAEDGSTLLSAVVAFSGVDPQPVDESGTARATLPPGPVTIDVAAPGYVAQRLTRDVVGGTPLSLEVALQPDVSEPDKPDAGLPVDGEIGSNDPGAGDDDGATVIPVVQSGGCGCAQGDPDGSTPLVAACAVLVVAWRTRRRVARAAVRAVGTCA